MSFTEWPILMPAELADEWDAFDPGTRSRAEMLAGRVLWALSGQRFGLRDDTVRPCFTPQHATTYGGTRGAGAVFWPGLAVGNAAATGPCGCSSDCRKVGYDRVALPGPVHSVTEVMVDGNLIDPAAYRLQNRRWLRRVDGRVWPTHQDLNAADDAPGAFTIAYQRGLPVPEDGQIAAGHLAVEFARGLTAGTCALPSGATNVSRQGVSVELADIREWFTNGLTGVEPVDLWIMAINPLKVRRPGRITSPDAPRVARLT